MTVITPILLAPRVTSPAAIKRRLLACWNLKQKALIGVEVRTTDSRVDIIATLSVAEWQASGASRVTGTVFMGLRAATVTLTLADLERQEPEMTDFDEFLNKF